LGRAAAQLAGAGAVITGTTLFNAWVVGREDVTNIVLIYLFAIAWVSLRFGNRAAVLAGIASALLTNYYFLAPYYSFAIGSRREIVTFAGMVVTAVFVSGLQERFRKQARVARHSERRTEALYVLTRELVDASSLEALCVSAARRVELATNVGASILLRDGEGFTRAFSGEGAIPLNPEDVEVAGWAASHLETAGAGTRNHPSAPGCYLPLMSSRGCVGILALRARVVEPGGTVSRPSSLVLSMARQIALALDRAMLSDEKQRAVVDAETERIRSAVLSSVSHDLRTPLSVITSASSAMLEHGDRLAASARTELCRMIHDEGRRLNELLRSLLDVTRLQGGNLHVNREWESLEEVIGSVLGRVEEQSIGRQIRANVPSDLPLVQVDATLIEQVLLNLVDNAFKHSLSERSVEIEVTVRDESVVVSVIDHGRGVRGDELDHIFDKFYRDEGGTSGGLGLGLTIARGIVQAHGGRMWAAHTSGGGLTIHFTLPVTGSPAWLAGIESLEEGTLQESV
jgi:two-component system sensor histidine kinase KdpD